MPAEPQRLERGGDGPITSQFGRPAPAADYLKGLNPEQAEAVLTIDGPLLVLAGAGTGKPRVLTTRIAHLLSPRKARSGEGMPWLGTFHSIGARLLRRHAELVGLRSDFTILDTDDQIRLIKQLIEVENLDEKRWPARQFAGMLDNWKNRGILPKDVTPAEAGVYANGRAKQLYSDYQARLKTLNAVDFGDLLLENIRL